MSLGLCGNLLKTAWTHHGCQHGYHTWMTKLAFFSGGPKEGGLFENPPDSCFLTSDSARLNPPFGIPEASGQLKLLTRGPLQWNVTSTR